MMSEINKWSRNNKLAIFFILTTLCLFVSTVALSAQMRARSAQKLFDNGPSQRLGDQNAVNSNISDQNYYRLPRHVVPKNYELLLMPYISKKMFSGVVTITLSVFKPTRTISLHSNNLTIHEVSLTDTNNLSVPILLTNASADKRELLNVNLGRAINNEYYKLFIKFSGRLDQRIIGFYASNLKTGGTMVVSKFQPTYARQAFPCFDEPDFKATFDITLWKPASYIALSNMNEITTTLDLSTNMDKVTFATSVPMSTYLACFVVCDFDHKETDINAGGIGKNFKLRSFAQRNELHKIDFAQDIGKRATEFYIRYYEVPFPLPKLDMIAIPDYVSGATEHWGLITFRETSFLVDKDKASAANKLSVANTIAHELAHMWFGNLVTMKWWDEVWLNEGFATYMQVKALNSIEPSWAMLDHFVTKTLHPVLKKDAKLSSHPIVQTVASPDEITAIFDAISYNKGASILRMLEGFTGEENFRLGVSDYLKKFEFSNTVTQDLLSSLEPHFKKDHPDLDITHIMNTWTQQMGFPVLSVKRALEMNTFVVSQSRFLLDTEAVYPNNSPFNYRWFVPITYKSNSGVNNEITWFPETENRVLITLEDREDWLKLNNDNVGYYRVNYSLNLWQKLIVLLKSKSEKLTVSDRCNLLSDVFELAEARMVPYELALNLSSYLVSEEDYEPWTSAAAIFQDLEERLLNSLAYDYLRKYVQCLVTPLYEKQSWDRDDLGITESLLRTRIISLAVRFGVPDALQKVNNLFFDWLKTHGTPENVPIKQDLRDIVYYYAMKSASQAEWDQLWEIYLKEEDAQEKLRLRNALAAPRDINILRRYLLLAWDESKVRSQDYLNVMQQLSANPGGAGLVWDETRAGWLRLVARFTLNSRYLGGLLPAITSGFNTELKLREMESFFAQYRHAGAGESQRRVALETVRNNIRWTAQYEQPVTDWLRNNHQL